MEDSKETLADAKIIPERMISSVTDNQVYPDFCLKASNSYATFIDFRREPIYIKTLEHVKQKTGGWCLELISKDPVLLANMEEFKRNDEFGNPIVHEYPGVGKVSATTLRYIKILMDLKRRFGDLDDLKICEIGVGYGGQCRTINAMYHPQSYRLVDIQPALMLAQRYLDHFILNSVMSYKTMNALFPEAYDLVISNYAFSELPRSVQEVYLEKIILNAKSGYMICNYTNPESFNSFTAEELLKIIPGSSVGKENPQTHPNNFVLTWDNS